MRFSDNWLATKPNEHTVLDIAYITVLIPLLFVLKLPLLAFVFISVGLIAAGKKPTPLTLTLLTLIGIASIFFSLYGSFNFAGLSRLKLFVELLIYLLLLAVALQRLTGTINFYLRISPALLLALTLFFFHGIAMLVYVFVAVFVLFTVLLWQIMQTRLRDTLRVATLFYVASLPIVVVFFIFFPRISFEHASYGFKGDMIHRTGHDGLMHLDNAALLVPSERIVMEVGFEKQIPLSSALYFRGSVLYTKENQTWKPLPPHKLPPSRPNYTYQNTVYKVTLYPTDKRWLYLLDIPLETPQKSALNYHLETTVEKPLQEPLLYTATSSLQSSYADTLPNFIKNASLTYDTQHDLLSQKLAKTIKSKYPMPTQRLETITTLFKAFKLTYTLNPQPFDLNNSTDSFLFDKKKGYCVHFSAAFVTLCRMADIPARIVTGYKPDGGDSVENYLIVRESDAHAWAEVYIEGAWRRVETTAFAAFFENNMQIGTPDGQIQDREKSSLTHINLYLHYLKYQVDTWILEYSALSQKRLFSYLKDDTLFLISFIAGIAVLIALVLLASYFIVQSRCKDTLLCTLKPLLKKLGEISPRASSESLNTYFIRLEENYHIDLASINLLYHQLRYKVPMQKEDLRRFKASVSLILKKL